MKDKMRGRKSKYTDELLIAEIMRYSHEYPGCRIQISSLVAYTGISKATWHRSAAAISKINQLNYAPLIATISKTSLPTLSEVKKTCGDDPQKYIEMISMLLDLIPDSTDEHPATSESKTESQLVQQLRLEIKKKDKLIDRLNVKINALTNQDDKLINLQDNIEKLDAATFDQQFEDQFGDLFS